jgi:uncharacterized membrane protein YphA (DoxX/SURF4 family)
MTDIFRTEPQAMPRWRNWTAWGLQGLAALVFLAAGGAKLLSVPSMVEVFEGVGAGQWFRYVTGSIEIAGAVLLLIPATVLAGAALLGCVMLGATYTHLFLIGGSALPALVLLALLGAVAWLRRPR